MEWLVGLLLLVVGVVIGFFVAKYFNDEEKQRQDSEKNEQTVKELMAQQAIHHLQESKKIAQQLSQQSEALNQQILHYEQTVIAQKSGDENMKLNYFGEHATTYLRNKSEDPSREKDNANVQPLDFSSEASGLFSGSAGFTEKENK
ncbi:DUF1043 family protein [Paraglaciecola aquimarina]|uniref:DUF1043 family protein n=1 Tax=Paraglaciecola aquimarina TaxID=1235557 RepID=A0ABU3SS28_9ALTE|nr:DUF1043 family protein [Paraglaciecola aquimarina]MDU0352817.1 DUF1043 family protein [Paraglaciecola aquimarina]